MWWCTLSLCVCVEVEVFVLGDKNSLTNFSGIHMEERRDTSKRFMPSVVKLPSAWNISDLKDYFGDKRRAAKILEEFMSQSPQAMRIMIDRISKHSQIGNQARGSGLMRFFKQSMKLLLDNMNVRGKRPRRARSPSHC